MSPVVYILYQIHNKCCGTMHKMDLKNTYRFIMKEDFSHASASATRYNSQYDIYAHSNFDIKFTMDVNRIDHFKKRFGPNWYNNMTKSRSFMESKDRVWVDIGPEQFVNFMKKYYTF